MASHCKLQPLWNACSLEQCPTCGVCSRDGSVRCDAPAGRGQMLSLQWDGLPRGVVGAWLSGRQSVTGRCLRKYLYHTDLLPAEISLSHRIAALLFQLGDGVKRFPQRSWSIELRLRRLTPATGQQSRLAVPIWLRGTPFVLRPNVKTSAIHSAGLTVHHFGAAFSRCSVWCDRCVQEDVSRRSSRGCDDNNIAPELSLTWMTHNPLAAG